MEAPPDIYPAMARHGQIKKDGYSQSHGLPSYTHKSRGYYIAFGGVWYLHYDGLVKHGVVADSEKPAFWPTFEDAEKFFSVWKDDVLLSL